MLMPMREFDVILGMDWLAAYNAKFDYFAKNIEIELPSKERLVVATTKGNKFTESFMASIEDRDDDGEHSDTPW